MELGSFSISWTHATPYLTTNTGQESTVGRALNSSHVTRVLVWLGDPMVVVSTWWWSVKDSVNSHCYSAYPTRYSTSLHCGQSHQVIDVNETCSSTSWSSACPAWLFDICHRRQMSNLQKVESRYKCFHSVPLSILHTLLCCAMKSIGVSGLYETDRKVSVGSNHQEHIAKW